MRGPTSGECALNVAPISRLVTDDGNGFHAPSINDFYPDALFGDGTFYEFNRVMLVRMIAAVLLVGIMIFVARRATVVVRPKASDVVRRWSRRRWRARVTALGRSIGPPRLEIRTAPLHPGPTKQRARNPPHAHDADRADEP